MDFTSRMVALLGELRRERNGAVADAMRCYGAPYGLNYGVSLPTLRRLARAETPDHDFARYLYRQDVRELRLAALHIARPESLAPDEFQVWAAGIVNSEVAEEAAFAFLSRADALPALFDAWIADPNPLLRYAALHSAARSGRLTAAWIAPAVEAVRRAAELAAASVAGPLAGSVAESVAESASGTIAEPVAGPVVESAAGFAVKPAVKPVPDPITESAAESAVESVVEPAVESAVESAAGPVAEPAAEPVAEPVAGCAAGSVSKPAAVPLSAPLAARLIAQGAVALLAAVGALNGENRQAVLRAAGSLGKLPAEDYVHEELAWRLEA